MSSSFHKAKFHQLSNGWILETSAYCIFFGGKNSEVDKLKLQFKKWSFLRVKQVHGVQIVDADATTSDLACEADGLFSTEKNIALCSITADCMPVLIVHESGAVAMALHAGWRGVAQRIVPTGIEKLLDQEYAAADLQVFIGPHILQNSFEVQDDALGLLAASTELPADAYSIRTSDSKFRADLSKIVYAQLAEYNIGTEQIRQLPMDTMTAPHFHSFRRDAKEAGRQISFVVLKSQL